MEKQLIETLSTYQGVTAVTHNLEEAYRVCKNLWFFQKAKQLPTVPKKTSLSVPHFIVAQLTGCKNFSRAQHSPHRVELLTGLHLRVIEPMPSQLTYVGTPIS